MDAIYLGLATVLASGSRLLHRRSEKVQRSPSQAAAAKETVAEPQIVYPKLDRAKRQIRTLKLKGADDGRLSCTLSVSSLDTDQPYDALSYVWAADAPSHELLVDDQLLLVRTNLYDYLKLAAEKHYHPYGIFIDAVCINQSDLGERSDQVALMGSVYKQAVEVVAWFGAEAFGGIYDDLPAPDEADMARRLRIVKESSSNTTLAFVHNSYWSRVWTVQEYVLARCLTMRAGDLEVNSTDFGPVLVGTADDIFDGNVGAHNLLRIMFDAPRKTNDSAVGGGRTNILQCAFFVRQRAEISKLSRGDANDLCVIPGMREMTTVSPDDTTRKHSYLLVALVYALGFRLEDPTVYILIELIFLIDGPSFRWVYLRSLRVTLFSRRPHLYRYVADHSSQLSLAIAEAEYIALSRDIGRGARGDDTLVAPDGETKSRRAWGRNVTTTYREVWGESADSMEVVTERLRGGMVEDM